MDQFMYSLLWRAMENSCKFCLKTDLGVLFDFMQSQGRRIGQKPSQHRSKYNKDDFLQANFRFLVSDAVDVESFSSHADKMFDWKDIAQVCWPYQQLVAYMKIIVRIIFRNFRIYCLVIVCLILQLSECKLTGVIGFFWRFLGSIFGCSFASRNCA